MLDTLPVISIGEIAPVDEADGMFTVDIDIRYSAILAGRDLTISTLTVADVTNPNLTYNPQVVTDPIVITNSSENNAAEVTITFTKDSNYVGWEDLTVSLDQWN